MFLLWWVCSVKVPHNLCLRAAEETLVGVVWIPWRRYWKATANHMPFLYTHNVEEGRGGEGRGEEGRGGAPPAHTYFRHGVLAV